MEWVMGRDTGGIRDMEGTGEDCGYGRYGMYGR